MAKKGKGRGTGRTNRTNRSTASLASFEDSYIANEPEMVRPRSASVSRKGSKGDFSLEEENKRFVVILFESFL